MMTEGMDRGEKMMMLMLMLMLMLMIFGGCDRRCSVHRVSSIIRYQAVVRAKNGTYLFRLHRFFHAKFTPDLSISTDPIQACIQMQ